jgi:hypothetical protein
MSTTGTSQHNTVICPWAKTVKEAEKNIQNIFFRYHWANEHFNSYEGSFLVMSKTANATS